MGFSRGHLTPLEEIITITLEILYCFSFSAIMAFIIYQITEEHKMNTWIRKVCYWAAALFLIITLIAVRDAYSFDKKPKYPESGQSPENKRPSKKEIEEQRKKSDRDREKWDKGNRAQDSENRKKSKQRDKKKRKR